jgi:transposase
LGSCQRKFYEVQQATGSPVAAEALRRIAEFYATKTAIRGQTAVIRQSSASVQIVASGHGDEGLA